MCKFVICIDNTGYETSLEPRKIYEVVADPEAGRHNQLRIIDESGEDYLFPQHMFMPLALDAEMAERVAKIA